jgi:hypothetical protein
METVTRAAALMTGLLLAACDGGMTVGGPPPDDAESEMLAADPMVTGEIDDATGTQIP